MESKCMVLTRKKVQPHVLWAKINRPKALNAIDYDVMEQLEQLVDHIEGDETIRVFILSGVGEKSFVSGGDLKKFHSIKSKEEAINKATRMQRLLLRIESLPCWTLAHINGDAFGGGIELMLAFDFRLSVVQAKFGFTQGKFYLTPGWGGLTRLTEQVGRIKALELLGKAEIKTANEVLGIGLIEHLLNSENPENETLEWVEKLTLNDRGFIKTLKAGSRRLSKNRLEALEAEVEPFSELWVDEQHLTRVEAFLNKKGRQ